MSTITTKKTTTKTCDRCGKTGLTWKKSTKTNRWYLSEDCMRQGYTGKWFPSSQLHKCPRPQEPLSTQPERPAYVTVYGSPEGPVDNPQTHVHDWQPWRIAPGGITGAWCQGCRGLMVD